MLETDFVEHVDGLAAVDTLDEQHRHRIDVEIDGPDEGMERFELQRLDVFGSMEGIVDVRIARAGEFGVELLAEGVGIVGSFRQRVGKSGARDYMRKKNTSY